MSNILTLHAIGRQYQTSAGPLDVLRGANLTIPAGELVALIGPSGSGKSTLLQIAGLLDTPNAGGVYGRGVYGADGGCAA